MTFSSNAVSRVCGYRLEVTAELIAHGFLESGRPGCGLRGLPRLRMCRVGVIGDTRGQKKRGTRIHRSSQFLKVTVPLGHGHTGDAGYFSASISQAIRSRIVNDVRHRACLAAVSA